MHSLGFRFYLVGRRLSYRAHELVRVNFFRVEHSICGPVPKTRRS
jgi:hypothetical protein